MPDGHTIAAVFDELKTIVWATPGNSGLLNALNKLDSQFKISQMKECELKESKLSQDDIDDIADMFAGYSSGSLSTAGRSQLMGFMSMHGDELKKLARQASQANGLGDMAYARDLGNDDLDESETPDTWTQTVTMKDKSGKVLSEYKWECRLNDQSNSDGFTDAFEQFAQVYPPLEDDYDLFDEIFDTLVIEQEPWTDGNVTITSDPVEFPDWDPEADLDESKAKGKPEEDVSETDKEINEIIGEEDDGASDTEKAIDEYSKIEDDVEEDDEMLSESVIRHATMLAREVW